MARINASVTDEFRQAVREYAEAQQLTESAALVKLAAIGLTQATGKNPGAAMRAHGGKRDRQLILAPEVKRNLKTKVTLDMLTPNQRSNPEVKPPSSVTLKNEVDDIDKRAESIIASLRFDYEENKRGVLVWNVYTKYYKADRAALNMLVKEGYIELVRKGGKEAAYKITEKGLKLK